MSNILNGSKKGRFVFNSDVCLYVHDFLKKYLLILCGWCFRYFKQILALKIDIKHMRTKCERGVRFGLNRISNLSKF